MTTKLPSQPRAGASRLNLHSRLGVCACRRLRCQS